MNRTVAEWTGSNLADIRRLERRLAPQARSRPYPHGTALILPGYPELPPGSLVLADDTGVTGVIPRLDIDKAIDQLTAPNRQ